MDAGTLYRFFLKQFGKVVRAFVSDVCVANLVWGWGRGEGGWGERRTLIDGYKRSCHISFNTV